MLAGRTRDKLNTLVLLYVMLHIVALFIVFYRPNRCLCTRLSGVIPIRPILVRPRDWIKPCRCPNPQNTISPNAISPKTSRNVIACYVIGLSRLSTLKRRWTNAVIKLLCMESASWRSYRVSVRNRRINTHTHTHQLLRGSIAVVLQQGT